MSRFSDYDDYEGEPEQILAYGRWQNNARRALKGKRGRQALRDLREALLALPEHRLIEGAVCTVGGVDKRLPLLPVNNASPEAVRYSEWARAEREEARKRLAAKGDGVCAIGAYAWYQKVKAGMDPAEAFATVPTIFDGDPDAEGSDTLSETAKLGKAAGLTYTLAWELAYRNDETYCSMTPEERWERFVAWIDTELAETADAA